MKVSFLMATELTVVVVVVVVFGVDGDDGASRDEILETEEAEGVMLPLGFGSRLVGPDSDGSGDPWIT